MDKIELRKVPDGSLLLDGSFYLVRSLFAVVGNQKLMDIANIEISDDVREGNFVTTLINCYD